MTVLGPRAIDGALVVKTCKCTDFGCASMWCVCTPGITKPGKCARKPPTNFVRGVLYA